MAAWYGLAPNRADATLGSPEAAIERLDHLWATFTATTPAEQTLDRWLAAAMRWSAAGMPTMNGGGPYDPATELALSGMEALGARPEYLGFPALLRSLCPHYDDVDWEAVAERRLRIVAGAIEVISGNTETFDSDVTLRDMGLLPHPADAGDANRWRMHRPLSLAGIAASGTCRRCCGRGHRGHGVPHVRPGHAGAAHGLLLGRHVLAEPAGARPAGRPHRRRQTPTRSGWSVSTRRSTRRRRWGGPGRDPRREKRPGGNLSLNQELDSILMINRWIERHGGSIRR